MAYLKRQSIPKTWPVRRKGTTYSVRPLSNIKDGVPLLVLIRDVLGIVQNRKEAKRIIRLNQMLLNGRKIKNEKESVALFDVITIIPSNKNYRMTILKNKKFGLEEIKESEAGQKIAKVVGKKMLKGKKVQLNLSDGMNFLSDTKCNTNDSIVVNLKEKKIEKCLPFKERTKILILSGKHAGRTGTTDKIDVVKKIAQIKSDNETIYALIKQLIVVE